MINNGRLFAIAGMAIAIVLSACQSSAPTNTHVPLVPTIPIPHSVTPIAIFDEDWRGFWRAWQTSCQMVKIPLMQKICTEGKAMGATDSIAVSAIAHFIQQKFQMDTTSEVGFATGYYVPEIVANRQYSARFRYPLHGVPKNLQARNDGRRVVAGTDKLYPTSKDIREQAHTTELSSAVLAWVENPVDVMNAQLQGSAIVRWANTKNDNAPINFRYSLLGFAEHNGYGFRSPTAYLLRTGQIRPEMANIQALREWAKTNPEAAILAMNENPRYIFFRLSAESMDKPLPIGSLGVRLTGQYTIAVDPVHIPLGSVLRIRFTHPKAGVIDRLVVASDTGDAIRGKNRMDYYWGEGDEAGVKASQTKTTVAIWPLRPNP